MAIHQDTDHYLINILTNFMKSDSDHDLISDILFQFNISNNYNMHLGI